MMRVDQAVALSRKVSNLSGKLANHMEKLSNKLQTSLGELPPDKRVLYYSKISFQYNSGLNKLGKLSEQETNIEGS